MVRGRKSTTVSVTLDQQIEKGQEKVKKTKAAYDEAVRSLQNLLDKRDAQRKDELWKAIINSSRTYDEILKHIKSDTASKDEAD